MNINYRKQVADFYKSKEYRKVLDFFNQMTIFDILGKARDENAHSSFLAWILSSSNRNHNLGTEPMKLFLQMICESTHHMQANIGNKFPTEFQNLDIIPDFNINNLNIIREQSISFSSKSSRDGGIDIFATFTVSVNNQAYDTVMVIENKVFSQEHENKASGKPQTEAYKEWVEKYYPNHKKILIYLSPKNSTLLASLNEVECSCKDYIQINYQMIVDNLINVLLEKELDVKIRSRLNDYLICLSKPSSILTNDVNKEIMAMGNEQRQILQEFWNKNKDLIIAAIDSLDLDEEEKAIMDKVKTTARSLFTISYNGTDIYSGVGMNRVAMEVIRHHCSICNTETYESLRKFFESVPVNTMVDGAKNIIAKQEDAINHQEKDRKTGAMKNVRRFHYEDNLIITLGNGNKIAVSTQWDENNNFKKMQDLITHWGYSIHK